MRDNVFIFLKLCFKTLVINTLIIKEKPMKTKMRTPFADQICKKIELVECTTGFVVQSLQFDL